MIKTYLKSYGYLFGLIIIMTILLSILNYFIPFRAETIKIIIPIISMFITSILLGKSTKEKGYLAGMKFSVIFILFTIIIKLIIKSTFNYKVLIIYITLLIASIIGSMIGINIKKNN